LKEYVCQRWTEEELLASRDSWQALLARSPADRLFMSAHWLQCWWRHHAQVLEAQPCVLAVHSQAGELVGLAPLYSRAARQLRVVRTRRLELMGNAWRDSRAVFSEYLDVIAAAGQEEAVRAALAEWLLKDGGWDELVLSNVRGDSVAARLASDLSGHALVRSPESMLAWSLELPATFDEFAAQLASNTRRKLLHQRAKLDDASFRELPRESWGDALARLETLVAGRWGPAGDSRRSFHESIIETLEPGAVRISELRSGSRCVSIMLNLRAGDTEYYLLSGFEPAFARGLSPGYLHLGFAIEAACGDGLRRFDLLAGHGLNRDYKRDFTAGATALSSFHVVRHGPLRALFRVADALRGRTDITSRK